LFSFSLYIFLFIDIIKTFVDSIEYFIESDQSFKINLCEPEPETISFEYDSEESDEFPTESSQSESIPSSPIKRQKRIIPFDDKKKAVDYWKSGKTKRLSLSSVSARFRFVTSIQQLYEFEKQIESQGSRNDKLNEIWAYTFQEFKNAKDNKLIVHD
jgi:hypothetical protein